MKIVVDGFGGDNAPLSVIKGCLMALEEFENLNIAICGDEEKLKSVAKENGLNLDRMEIYSDDCLIDEEIKSKNSMKIGLKVLKEKSADALISAGNTGDLVIGACTEIGRLENVKRVALSPIVPCHNGKFLLIDAGANLKCSSTTLLNFGIMGACYAEKVLKIKNPKVGLANIGTEEFKGPLSHQEAYKLLQRCPNINFIGNVEARDVPLGACDVVVADGFSGNTILKTMEGSAKFISRSIKQIFNKSAATKIAGLILKKHLLEMKQNLNSSNYGGAILLGVLKPIIKAHGNSDAIAIKNAIKQAISCINGNVVEDILKKLHNFNFGKET